MEVRAMVCPQCGSGEVTVSAPGWAKCASCDSLLRFTEKEGEAKGVQAVPLQQATVPSTVSREAFLRAVWRKLAAEGAPDGMFQQELTVEKRPLRLFRERIRAGYHYTASIGYYGELIRWQPFAGEHSGTSEVITEDTADPVWDMKKLALALSLEEVRPAGLAAEPPCAEATGRAAAGHLENLALSLKEDLPGDDSRDITVTIDEETVEEQRVLLAETWHATLIYEGKPYFYDAPAFGTLSVSGFVPKAEIYPAYSREDGFREGWLAAGRGSVISLIPAAVFVPLAMILPYRLILIPAFLTAVGAFVWGIVRERRILKVKEAESKRRRTRATEAVRERRLALVNGKLTSLGLDSLRREDLR